MSSRHVEEGAGREYVDPRDYSCDYCSKTIYGGLLHQVTLGRSISWLCPTCFDRMQDEYERMVAS